MRNSLNEGAVVGIASIHGWVHLEDCAASHRGFGGRLMKGFV